MSMLQNANAKMQRRRKRDNSRTNPAIHRKELFEKGGAFFSLSKFFENRIEYMFGLLYGIDLFDAENVEIDQE